MSEFVLIQYFDTLSYRHVVPEPHLFSNHEDISILIPSVLKHLMSSLQEQSKRGTTILVGVNPDIFVATNAYLKRPVP
jgi:hypothetical protein